MNLRLKNLRKHFVNIRPSVNDRWFFNEKHCHGKKKKRIITSNKEGNRMKILLKQGLVHDVELGEIKVQDLLMEDGKIKKIADTINDAEAVVYDVKGKHVYPGMVEAHCHMGLHEAAIQFEGNDTNESSDPIMPHVRGIDGINPMDEAIQDARAAGITTVCAGPGSADVIGGTFCAYKTYGNCIDEMLIKDPVAMKCAFGENPKRVFHEKGIKTRMNVAALLRKTLLEAKQYAQKKDAAYDMKLAAMQAVIEKQIPLKIHAHRADDICTAIRIAKEFDVKATLDHCTEGHLIVDQVVKSGFPAICGPSMSARSKYELKHKSFETAGILAEQGVLVAITTDSPVIPQEYLPYCAALCMKHGMREADALRAITINPAKIIALDDRIGSLKEGKDGDVVVCDGSIFDLQTHVLYTFINGELVYEKKRA